MKLLRKYNPEAAPFISNPNGLVSYRVIAVVLDGISDRYICFYDQTTGKVYIEEVTNLKVGHEMTVPDLHMVTTDKAWQDIIEYLSTDECKVIQTVSNSYEKNKDTGELTIHENLKNLPRVPYGVDKNGVQAITKDTPSSMLISPCLTDGDGRLL